VPVARLNAGITGGSSVTTRLRTGKTSNPQMTKTTWAPFFSLARARQRTRKLIQPEVPMKKHAAELLFEMTCPQNTVTSTCRSKRVLPELHIPSSQALPVSQTKPLSAIGAKRLIHCRSVFQNTAETRNNTRCKDGISIAQDSIAAFLRGQQIS